MEFSPTFVKREHQECLVLCEEHRTPGEMPEPHKITAECRHPRHATPHKAGVK